MAFNTKKYNREFLGAALIYSVVVIASRYAASIFDAKGAALALLALSPIVPAIGATAVYLRHYRDMDELQRRIQVDSFAAAALFVCLVSFTIGFAEDVIFPRISMIWILPATFLVWGVIACVVRARYSK